MPANDRWDLIRRLKVKWFENKVVSLPDIKKSYLACGGKAPCVRNIYT